jgi:hypothetical protein
MNDEYKGKRRKQREEEGENNYRRNIKASVSIRSDNFWLAEELQLLKARSLK